MCLICCNCGSCGKPLPDEIVAFYNAPKLCLGCGEPIGHGEEACPKCGRAAVRPPGEHNLGGVTNE